MIVIISFITPATEPEIKLYVIIQAETGNASNLEFEVLFCQKHITDNADAIAGKILYQPACVIKAEATPTTTNKAAQALLFSLILL